MHVSSLQIPTLTSLQEKGHKPFSDLRCIVFITTLLTCSFNPLWRYQLFNSTAA